MTASRTGLDDDDALADRAVALARRLLAGSLADATRSERKRRRRLGRLLQDPQGRELIFALTDEVVRIELPTRAARRFADVVRRHPTRAVGSIDRLLLRSGALVAPLLPRLAMPLVVGRIKHETRGMVLPAEDPGFSRHLRARAADGVRLNVNSLGESILSDHEAEHRMQMVCERIDRPDVDYISVKVSAVVANLDVLAFDDSLDRISERLRQLYRRATSSTPASFVNLDMEEYRDLELTLQSFMRVLDEPEFRRLDAGIVLQAYLPDSHAALERLGRWATERHAAGGGTIKVRLVKGANLAMETVEAEMHGWTAAPYGSKADVDASYKAIIDSALRPEWAAAIRIGLASHNLFDVAWALCLGEELGALDRIEFEMLEGMAPAQARQVHTAAGRLLMYAPVVAARDFTASIAYLTRRLDENTQPDNFLRSLFTLTPDSPLFDSEAARFRASVTQRHSIFTAKRRAPQQPDGRSFTNAPESDMTDPAVRAAVGAAIDAPPVPTVVRVVDVDGIDAIVAAAVASCERNEHTRSTRGQWLLAAAELMDAERAPTIGLMTHEVGKTAHEGDPEVCEAVDFCRYYATDGSAALDDAESSGLHVRGRGVVVVVGPWNFPYAIPTGGVAAAIAAGNSVILKPAPEAVATGTWIAEQLWRAGVPRDVLQVVVCDDGPVGTRLVSHAAVDTVVLTGSHQTASMFLDWRPDMRVLAETSGKDAMIITASADLDLAIADLVRSAFGHAGQKCSAASLGIIVGEVYDDPSFRARFRDAVGSLRVGPATDLATMMGPLVQSPSGPLLRALTTLEPGESWLVQPAQLASSSPRGSLWSPGVRLDVAPGSWFHQTECFGPVLGLMRADDLDHAIALQNDTPFGLTGGIHSLDTAEIDHWVRHVEVGNAYVNRAITGAIVRRQPFGGWKRSAVGGGAKAGGPGYVAQFACIDDPVLDRDAARQSFERAWAEAFSAEHDPSALIAERNVLRYVPLGRVAVRHDGLHDLQLAVIREAAAAAGVELVESSTADETDAAFAERCVTAGVERVRLLCGLDDDARRALHRADIVIDTTPPVGHGVLELQHWVREQTISRTAHRHGRLNA